MVYTAIYNNSSCVICGCFKERKLPLINRLGIDEAGAVIKRKKLLKWLEIK